MYAPACQCIEEHRECGNECLAFAGGHLCNPALVERDAADELHVIMHHVPFQHIAASHPCVGVYSLVAFYCDVVETGGEFAVHVGGGNFHCLIFGETACCILYDCESLWQHFVELDFEDFLDVFFRFLYVVVEFLLLLYCERVVSVEFVLEAL